MGLTAPGAATPWNTVPGDVDGRLPVFPFGRVEPRRYGAFRADGGGVPAALRGAGHGIPGHDAFPHLFNVLDPEGPCGVPTRMLADWGAQPGDVTAIDGRALRRSIGDAPERPPLHPARALVAESGPLLGQGGRRTGRDHGGVRAAGASGPDGDRGRDAQAADTEAGGGHLPAPEGGQGTPRDGLRIHPKDPENAETMMPFRDVDRDHGRPGPAWFPGTVRPQRAAGNSPHRILDVTMDGDRQRNRTDSLALMRRTSPGSLRERTRCAGNREGGLERRGPGRAGPRRRRTWATAAEILKRLP